MRSLERKLHFKNLVLSSVKPEITSNTYNYLQ